MIVSANDEAIAEAARILRGGGLVVFPTETVYGLGADATNGEAVARIFEAKGRPRFNPLIVHVSDAGAAREFACFGESALLLAEKFWPGPLTLVLPLRDKPGLRISELATAGLDTVAIRVPAHPVARKLLALAGIPVAAPSANVSGRVSPTLAWHAEEDLGSRVEMVLDGGSTRPASNPPSSRWRPSQRCCGQAHWPGAKSRPCSVARSRISKTPACGRRGSFRAIMRRGPRSA